MCRHCKIKVFPCRVAPDPNKPVKLVGEFDFKTQCRVGETLPGAITWFCNWNKISYHFQLFKTPEIVWSKLITVQCRGNIHVQELQVASLVWPKNRRYRVAEGRRFHETRGYKITCDQRVAVCMCSECYESCVSRGHKVANDTRVECSIDVCILMNWLAGSNVHTTLKVHWKQIYFLISEALFFYVEKSLFCDF